MRIITHISRALGSIPGVRHGSRLWLRASKLWKLGILVWHVIVFAIGGLAIKGLTLQRLAKTKLLGDRALFRLAVQVLRLVGTGAAWRKSIKPIVLLLKEDFCKLIECHVLGGLINSLL